MLTDSLVNRYFPDATKVTLQLWGFAPDNSFIGVFGAGASWSPTAPSQEGDSIYRVNWKRKPRRSVVLPRFRAYWCGIVFIRWLAHRSVRKSPVKRSPTLGILLAGLWLLSGCTTKTTPSTTENAPKTFSGNYPIQATVTVGMVADLVRAIGGEHVQVKQLLGAEVDPHLYKPTRDDTSALLSADIIFFNGLLLEGKMAETLVRMSGKVRAFAAAESLPASLLGSDPTEQAHPDPHVWMNVEMWSQVAQAIGDELARFDPKHQADYELATSELRAELKRLHQYGVEMMACVPPEQRVLITSHDAFRYFGAGYNVEVQAVQGISTESEAGLLHTNQLVRLLVERKITSVFIESSVPKEHIEALIGGAASKKHTVRIAGSLFSDAMGHAGTYEGTYIGMMDHNLSSIARALGCERVPEEGFRGWQADAP